LSPYSKGFAGSQHRIVDKTLVRFGNLSDDASVCGIYVGKFALPGYELPVDEIQNGLQWYEPRRIVTASHQTKQRRNRNV
jgi:hypothetical protein